MTLVKVRFVQFPVLLCARSLISLPILVSLAQEQHTSAASRHKGSVDNLGGPVKLEAVHCFLWSRLLLKYSNTIKTCWGSSGLDRQCLFMKVQELFRVETTAFEMRTQHKPLQHYFTKAVKSSPRLISVNCIFAKCSQADAE